MEWAQLTQALTSEARDKFSGVFEYTVKGVCRRRRREALASSRWVVGGADTTRRCSNIGPVDPRQ